MLNQVTILGRVTEVFDDRDAIMVVVRTGGGRKKTGGTWEELAACRFWGDAKKWTKEIGPGALVKIDASAKSRRSDKGVVFTNIEARYLQVVQMPGAKAEPARDRSEPASPPAADDDGTDIPF